MNKVMDKLKEVFDIFYSFPCNHECDKCVLGKKFIDEEYKDKNLCDVLEVIYDEVKEDK